MRPSVRTSRDQAPLAGCEPAAKRSGGGALLAGSKCEHAWRRQRKENDWAGFAPNLKRGGAPVAGGGTPARRGARGAPYDAMLALYEPGMTSARLDQIFGDLTSWLPGLIQTVSERQKRDVILTPQGPFPVATQQALGQEVMGCSALISRTAGST